MANTTQPKNQNRPTTPVSLAFFLLFASFSLAQASKFILRLRCTLHTKNPNLEETRVSHCISPNERIIRQVNMADCGAGGSALDRAARALASTGTNGGGAASADAANMGKALGHAAASLFGQRVGVGGGGPIAGQSLSASAQQGGMAMSMPATAPDHLDVMMPPDAAAAAAELHQQRPHDGGGPATMMHPQSSSSWQRDQQHIHHHHHNMMMQQQQHQHAAAAAAMAQAEQQHHMMAVMHQQQQHLMRLNAMQQQQMQHQQAELQQQQNQQQQQQLEGEEAEEGHPGLVQPASIEELAAAWAEAQDEYQQLEDAVNLASAVVGEGDEHVLPTYEFVNKDNGKQETETNRDWMSDGVRQFEAGNLKEAIYAFEMELQQNDGDNATAWHYLGRCHAENDQDPLAIVCLEHAVDRDPYASRARLALGVSYVNELDHRQALSHLKAWITHNPTFAGMELDEDMYGSNAEGEGAAVSGGGTAAFEEVQRLLLRALDFAKVSTDSDSAATDVLEALGVVYNVSRDYDAAVDAFEKAIAARPDDYQLYNRLGATLANAHQSERALPAYRKALSIKPKYARAWLNMAISHSNLQSYKEAARCYLQTLSLNPAAIHCWSYLRIALSCAEQWDLIPHAVNRELGAFVEHYDFVMYDAANSEGES